MRYSQTNAALALYSILSYYIALQCMAKSWICIPGGQATLTYITLTVNHSSTAELESQMLNDLFFIIRNRPTVHIASLSQYLCVTCQQVYTVLFRGFACFIYPYRHKQFVELYPFPSCYNYRALPRLQESHKV